MAKVYYISHTNVDPDLNIVDITSWDLSEKGRQRAEVGSRQPWIKDIKTVYSSNEKKAKTTAELLFQNSGIKINHLEELGETDRTSTGPLPREEHDELARQFMDFPDKSARGWETANHALERTIKAIDEVIEKSSEGDIAIVGHGGVGTLYLCHLKNIPINRKESQPDMGAYFIFDSETKELIQDWKLIDTLES